MGNSSQMQDGLPSYSYQHPESDTDQRSIANSEENFRADQFYDRESPVTKTPKAKRNTSEKPIKWILKAKITALGSSNSKIVKYNNTPVGVDAMSEVGQK